MVTKGHILNKPAAFKPRFKYIELLLPPGLFKYIELLLPRGIKGQQKRNCER